MTIDAMKTLLAIKDNVYSSAVAENKTTARDTTSKTISGLIKSILLPLATVKNESIQAT